MDADYLQLRGTGRCRSYRRLPGRAVLCRSHCIVTFPSPHARVPGAGAGGTGRSPPRARSGRGLRRCGIRDGPAAIRPPAELLDAAERGNVTVITRHGRATAAIVPAALLDRLGKPDGEPLPPDGRLRGARPRLASSAMRCARWNRCSAGKPRRLAVAHAVPHQARPGRPGLVAASLADLRGPAHGVVELPLRLFWSAPGHAFDLDQPSMVQAMYEAVLREASRPGGPDQLPQRRGPGRRLAGAVPA